MGATFEDIVVQRLEGQKMYHVHWFVKCPDCGTVFCPQCDDLFLCPGCKELLPYVNEEHKKVEPFLTREVYEGPKYHSGPHSPMIWPERRKKVKP